jgi:hypothetical protein
MRMQDNASAGDNSILGSGANNIVREKYYARDGSHKLFIGGEFSQWNGSTATPYFKVQRLQGNVDGPTITGVASQSNGSFTTGQTVTLEVTFSEAVTVTGAGTPYILLATNSSPLGQANYTGGSGTTTLTFDYVVGGGHINSDLEYSTEFALITDGNSITSTATSVPATIHLPIPGHTGSLGKNSNVDIN